MTRPLAKEALLVDDPAVCFTAPHFDGFPAVLIRLHEIVAADLEEIIVDAWVARAPRKLADAYVAAHGGT